MGWRGLGFIITGGYGVEWRGARVHNHRGLWGGGGLTR